MHALLQNQFADILAGLNEADESFVPSFVDALLDFARRSGASDIHLVPVLEGLDITLRLDGVLHPLMILPRFSANVVARLKVLADLLTYRTDVPQEGRLKTSDKHVQMRLSTFPTLYGEKGVVRLFVGSGRYHQLDDLGLADDVATRWRSLLTATNGVLIVSGPAGSGKTTLLYASLREILATSIEARSLVSLEDPIEAVVPGVAQSQVKSNRGRGDEDTFDYPRGLRSILRQDPEVILVGEVRDRETAETVFQASLSGHLVLTSFHAGSTAEGISRLADMQIEPYLLRSGLLGIVGLRLLRRLCECRTEVTAEEDALGLTLERCWRPVGCQQCQQTGYAGRMLISEILQPEEGDVGRAILERTDAGEIQRRAVAAGMQSLFQRALGHAAAGETSPMEVRRVFGFPPIVEGN